MEIIFHQSNFCQGNNIYVSSHFITSFLFPGVVNLAQLEVELEVEFEFETSSR